MVKLNLSFLSFKTFFCLFEQTKHMPSHKKGDKRLLRAWASYDWANSVYFLVISSAIFPLYYGYICADEPHLEVFGMFFKNTALISYVTALAFMFIAIWSPILSGIADYMGNKKRFMQFYCYLGSAACIGLYWFEIDNLYWGLFFLFFGTGWRMVEPSFLQLLSAGYCLPRTTQQNQCPWFRFRLYWECVAAAY